MSTLSNDEFWKRQFETAGNLPHLWVGTAQNLILSANILDKFAGNYQKEIIESTKSGNPRTPKKFTERLGAASVGSMLLAMATECLLKALWLTHGGKLASDGRYVGVLKKNEHALDQLAIAVAKRGNISFNARELDLPKLASFWISSGRYPIQKSHRSLVPFSREDGTIAPVQFWRGDARDELNELIEKLKIATEIHTRSPAHK